MRSWILAGLTALALGGSALAAYPERAVNYVIPFDPGGESDTTARLQQQPLESALGANITITNKAGGGGAVAWSDFQRTAKPDGYTVIGVNIPQIIVQPLQRADAGFATDDFAFVDFFQFTPNALIVRKDSPFTTLDDFLAYAKEHPGSLTVGGSGSQSANHIGTLLLDKVAGIQLTYVPFTGTGSAVPALLGGHVGALMSYTPVAVQYSDQVRTLAVAADERPSFLADVPTFKELGYDVVIGAYRGVAAPKGTPPEVLDKLISAFQSVTKTITPKQEALGFVVTDFSGEQARQLVEKNKSVYQEILKSLQ